MGGFDLATVANIASLICLPATIASIPGLIAVLSTRARDWFEDHKWAPVTLLIIMGLLVLADGGIRLGLIQVPKATLHTISNRHFHDEWVALDGNNFFDCTFENVVFSWNGGDTGMYNGHPVGHVALWTSNPSIMKTMDVLRNMGLIVPGFRVVPPDQYGQKFPWTEH